MGRKSNAAKALETEIKKERRPRRPRIKKEIPFGLRAGEIVLVVAPNHFKGKRFGIVIEACKHNDGGVNVRLSDDGHIARYYCVRPELGDTIERLPSSDGTTEDNKE